MSVRVLIVDDSVTIRAMLQELLGHDPNIVIVGLAADAHTAVCIIDRLRPQVTTLDILMPGTDGLTLLDTVRHRTRAIMLTNQAGAALQSVDRGAFGFFPKSEIFRDSRQLIRMVHRAALGKSTKFRMAERRANAC
ncbi:MAG: response regulator [Alphaproteobacteria bacterium]|nr:MAG: response regulator [Alphaproteobacteria bacterium]